MVTLPRNKGLKEEGQVLVEGAGPWNFSVPESGSGAAGACGRGMSHFLWELSQESRLPCSSS
jgi:hypothetical protein